MDINLADHKGLSGADTRRQSQSLRNQALSLLRQAVVHLRYAPGAVVSEAELVVQVGLGRTPVREAVARLEQEGLVTVLPRKGIQITPVTLVDLQALCELRMELEGLGARLAAERRTPEQLRVMQGLFAEAPVLIAANDLSQLLELDRDFHMLLARCTKNTYLERRSPASTTTVCAIALPQSARAACVAGAAGDGSVGYFAVAQLCERCRWRWAPPVPGGDRRQLHDAYEPARGVGGGHRRRSPGLPAPVGNDIDGGGYAVRCAL